LRRRPNRDRDKHVDSDSDGDADKYVDAYTGKYADAYSNEHADEYACEYGDEYADGHSDEYVDRNVHEHGHPDSNWNNREHHSNGDKHAYAYRHKYSDRHGYKYGNADPDSAVGVSKPDADLHDAWRAGSALSIEYYCGEWADTDRFSASYFIRRCTPTPG
jgi:hypothetical protein